MAEVSIIVPVYQVEKYIRQCVDSILAQTFTDFELILVDDGSTDKSGEICDEYAKVDGRVKVIHQTNGGLSSARNSGMDHAKGKYFMFIDSDDFIAPNMVECLYKSINEQCADIAVCNFMYYFEENKHKCFNTNIEFEILHSEDVFFNRKNERNFGIWTVAWNKLYKKEPFERIRFRMGKYHEDEFWANDIYQLNAKIVAIPECLYFYRQRNNSITSSKNNARNFDIIEAFQERTSVYLKYPVYANQAYKVLIYSLEYLAEAKELVSNEDEKGRFIQAEKRTRDIAKQIQKSRVSFLQRVSLIFIGLNPCRTFNMGMKFRGLLERFL